jgi:hypothetical protein
MNREAIELAQASLVHYRQPVSAKTKALGWLRNGPKRYLFAVMALAAVFVGCRVVPPIHAIVYPSVPVAPLVAASIGCRLLFGIGAGRLAAVLTIVFVWSISYSLLLYDPGVDLWVTGYTAMLIGISVKSA